MEMCQDEDEKRIQRVMKYVDGPSVAKSLILRLG